MLRWLRRLFGGYGLPGQPKWAKGWEDGYGCYCYGDYGWGLDSGCGWGCGYGDGAVGGWGEGWGEGCGLDPETAR